jgi:glycosyltransferase involved in cell wall biosynthesis
MFLNYVFYTLKPLIPRRVQIALRRRIAVYKRCKHAHIWPIDPHSATPPQGWAGWPEGKKFALVLSHDVDTARGYENVLKLVELEESMGFRSCFNFVPERYGRVSLDLMDELRRRGFGVGVHGLKHDGKLFISKRHFDRQAVRINGYLKEWETGGFTSPSMHRNLDWMTALNITYSTSTFDTDPFEPQPDGAGTIFPVVVFKESRERLAVSSQISPPSPSSFPASRLPGFFIELPYTLPQDSTLFIILKEKTIDIWKGKLDWIAENGGMALLNSHPDYMDFDGDGRDELLYPVQHYIDFLQYLQRRYAGRYFHALPSALASSLPCDSLNSLSAVALGNGGCSSRPSFFSLSAMPAPWNEAPIPLGSYQLPEPNKPNKPRKLPSLRASEPSSRALRVAMLSYSFYESDNRVRRYAETLARRGDHVDIISLRRPGQVVYSELNGVRVHRIQERVRDEKGKFTYLSKILKFFVRSAALLTGEHLKKPYDLVHVHSVPDFEVFAALVPKLAGAKVILDIHDIVPELYADKFHIGRNSSVFKSLVLAEQASAKFADHVIISNHLWHKRLCSRSVSNDKCTAILNYPDEQTFFKEFPKKPNKRFVFLYPGTLNFHQGLDLAVQAFSRIKDEADPSELHIIGEGPAREELRGMVRINGVQNRVFLKDPVPLDKIARIMSAADAGIIPKRNDGFGGEAFSTKSLEFMSLGVPIIVSRTRIDQYYFNDSVVKFVDPENVQDLAEGMLAMIRDKELRDRLAERGLEFARNFSWGEKKKIYLDLVDSLCCKEAAGD